MNNKGADQIAWMRRLICSFVVTYGKNRFSHDMAHIVFDADPIGVSVPVSYLLDI